MESERKRKREKSILMTQRINDDLEVVFKRKNLRQQQSQQQQALPMDEWKLKE